MPPPGRRRLVAVDGKTLRGSASGADPGRHLLAALDHARGVVLGQADVQAKTNEIPMLPILLDQIELSGAIVTADAMHAQREHARYLVAQRGAHYILTVKGNQPSLHAQLKALPWRDVPVTSDTRDRGHGRRERRTLKVTAVAAGLAFPHAAQAIQIVRRRRPLTGKKWSAETVYAIISLTPAQARAAQLAAALRGHWLIEDRLHWATGHDLRQGPLPGPHRHRPPRHGHPAGNLAISILRLTGATNIAAALRRHSRRPRRSGGWCSTSTTSTSPCRARSRSGTTTDDGPLSSCCQPAW
jgi:predicted transposase YbfD/YdcC